MRFASAANLPIQVDYRSPSPEEPPPGLDVDAWFNSAPMEALPLFTTAKSVVAPEHVGFTKASMDGVIKPSSEALAKAKALLEVWESEDPQRVALRAVENVGNIPGTPLSSGFSHPSIAGPPRVISSPTHLYRSKAFRSPLLKNMHTSSGVMPGSPLNPNRPVSSSSTPQVGFASPSSFITPLRSGVRPSGMLRTTPAPFATPFKPGMRPGEPGRSRLGQSSVVRTPPSALNAATKETSRNSLTKDRAVCVPERKEFFSLGWCTSLFPPHLYR